MIKLKVMNQHGKEIGTEWVDEKDGRWKNNCKWASTPDGVVPFNGTRLQYTNHDANCAECGGKGKIQCSYPTCETSMPKIPCPHESKCDTLTSGKYPCPACSGTGKIEVYEGDDVEYDLLGMFLGGIRSRKYIGKVEIQKGAFVIHTPDAEEFESITLHIKDIDEDGEIRWTTGWTAMQHSGSDDWIAKNFKVIKGK